MRTCCLVAAAILALPQATASAQQIDVVNNQPFAIHAPLRVRGVRLPARATAAQQVGDDAVVIVEAAAASRDRVRLEVPENVRLRNRVELKPAGDGAIGIAFDGKDVGGLSWGVIVRPVDTAAPRTQEKAIDTRADFAAAFKALPLAFSKAGEGPVFETWSTQASASGLKLNVELLAYRAGFLDVNVSYTNESAPTRDVYAAIVCRWQQPNLSKRVVCYDNRPAEFTEGDFTPFRHGEGRHLYIQRGLDWINATFGGASALWLHDFTPNFTTHHGERKSKTGETIGSRWLGANTAHVALEAQAKGDAIYTISEIARPNIAGYLARLAHNVLPPAGQGLTMRSRIVFADEAIADERADQHFIAYTGFNPQAKTANGAKVTFGVPFTRFGTNYFPYSTLGENFVTLKQPGMSKDGYWPLAPETVKQYKLFADDVRRDLRIAKAMGFELIRLHHLEVMWDLDPNKKPYLTEAQRTEYLDFYMDQIRHLGLKVLLDVKLSPQETAELVKRYRDVTDGVEIDNEVLIFQIYDADVQYWKDVYAAVKAVAPDMPVHLTTHTNTGAFERLNQLGVPYDRIGSHAYMDSLEAINSGKNYALSIAAYATKANKPPLITEWNWRFLTRMTPDARAKVYPPIIENVAKTRCMPVLYQFQFNDGLAMNPTGLKGIRHYEQLNLSRRPKPEALEMVKLIRTYGDPSAPQQAIRTEYEPIEMHADMRGNVHGFVHMTNTTDRVRTVKLLAEGPAGIEVSIRGQAEFDLAPGRRATGELVAKLSDDAPPGFYHVFARIDGGPDGVAYSWTEIRKPGGVKLDPHGDPSVAYGGDALAYDFNRPLAVVYPEGCTVMELEAAWVLYQTLEAATGRVVDIFQTNDLPADVRSVVWVGKGKADKPSVSREGDRLIVSGATEQEVTTAAMDLTLRYWRTSPHSGASRVGLVAESTSKGGVKTDLD